MSKIKSVLIAVMLFFAQAVSAVCPPTITNVTPSTYPAYATAPNPEINIYGTGFDESPVTLTVAGFPTAIPVLPVPAFGITVNGGGTNINIPAGGLPSFTFSPGALGLTVNTNCGSALNYVTITGDWRVYLPDENGMVYALNYTNLNATPTSIDTFADGCIQVVFSPDGRRAYSLNFNGPASTLVVIDTASNTAIQFVTLVNTSLSSVEAQCLAISSDGKTLLIGYISASSGPSTGINQYDLTLLTPFNPGSIVNTYDNNGNKIVALAFDPDGAKAYAVNASNQISVIDPVNQTIGFYNNAILKNANFWINPVPVGINAGPFNQMVSNADTFGDQRGLFFNSITTSSPPAPYANLALGSLNTRGQIIAAPNSLNAYCTNDNTIVGIIENPATTPTQGGAISIGTGSSRGFAISPKGDMGIAAYNTFSITPSFISSFPLTAGATGTSIQMPGDGINRLAIMPDQAPVAKAFVQSTSALTVTFNASASVSPTGTIATYFWDFGPGEGTATTANPIISHTFGSEGTKTVTLTVTNSQGTSTADLTRHFGQMNYNNGGPQAQTTLSVTVTGGCSTTLQPPARVRIIRGFHNCYYRNVLVITPPRSLPTPTSYLIYADPNMQDLLQVVPANGLNTVRSKPIKTRPPNACFYVYSQLNGAVSCKFRKACN